MIAQHKIPFRPVCPSDATGPYATGPAATGLDPGVEPGTPNEKAPLPFDRAMPKHARIMALLERPDGASLDDLIAATNWQPHAMRAALTRLRQKGRTILRTSTDRGSIYRIEAAHNHATKD